MEIIPNKLAIRAAVEGKTVKELVEQAMHDADGDRTQAARALGITRQGLWYHLAGKSKNLAQATSSALRS